MTPQKPKGEAWRVRMREEAVKFEAADKHVAAEHLHRAIIADARLEAALSPRLDDRQIRAASHQFRNHIDHRGRSLRAYGCDVCGVSKSNHQ